VPYQLFTRSLGGAATSLVASQGLITKVYFPRLLVPISAVLAALVDFAISFAILLVMMLFYGVKPSLPILALPAYTLLVLLMGLAVGLWLAALNVQYRDVGHLVPFFTQALMYLSPIMYPISLILDKLGKKGMLLYSLNPLVGVLEGFRWSLLGQGEVYLPALASSVIATAVVLFTGLAYFRGTEKVFADVV
jgi:lipopolysaccharide transport system permease protein